MERRRLFTLWTSTTREKCERSYVVGFFFFFKFISSHIYRDGVFFFFFLCLSVTLMAARWKALAVPPCSSQTPSTLPTCSRVASKEMRCSSVSRPRLSEQSHPCPCVKMMIVILNNQCRTKVAGCSFAAFDHFFATNQEPLFVLLPFLQFCITSTLHYDSTIHF